MKRSFVCAFYYTNYMPFKSYKQQQYMFIHHPKIAKKWAEKYGTITKSSKLKKRLKSMRGKKYAKNNN